MTGQYDVAVIGGGILGLAHAWMATRRGLKAVLFERSARAQGASVRNFGMVWPVGQPAGELSSLALRARELWLELAASNVVDVQECGSVHLAHHLDELAVLEEFSSRGTHTTNMLTPDEVVRTTSLVNPEGLLGGMWSPTELRVDPRTASAAIASWLESHCDVQCRFRTPVTRIDGKDIHSADGRAWRAERVIVCSGSDLSTLYPDVFLHSGLQLCKLQMLRTTPQPDPQVRPPHVASGLTLRHYTSFADCASLPALQTRIAEESPELDRFGIHVMASQFPGGEIIVGDSHEYGDDISPFDKSEIDELILRELRKVIRLSDWSIRERWHGIYARHPERPVFETETTEGTQVFVGTGGAGMTLAFGLAERAWKRWMGETE